MLGVVRPARSSLTSAATIVLILLAVRSVAAQGARLLSLKDAEQRALRNHPVIQAAQSAALAAGETVRETRSAYFPTVFGSFTGAEARTGSRVTAGGLNNPIVLDRFAAGFSVAQMLTDFGRTLDLVQSSSLRAEAQGQDVISRRTDVLLQVDGAYFDVLRAQAVQRVAQETVDARQVIVEQVSALAASNLKSGLDVAFAKVNLAEAQLLLVQARNDLQAAFASLSAALGESQSAAYELRDEPLPAVPPDDSVSLVAQALQERPDLASERLAEQAAQRFADAERALWRPTIAAVGTAGLTPYHQAGLANQYSAIGFNVSLPLANGSLFSARRAEAEFRASAEEQRLRDLENRVARDVQIAWLDSQTAYQRMDLTNQLLDQASLALDLAQGRYNLGLSSIVELTQAQLNKTRAEIEQATARYQYQTRISALKHAVGTLR